MKTAYLIIPEGTHFIYQFNCHWAFFATRNSLQNDKTLNSPKQKVSADDKINLT